MPEGRWGGGEEKQDAKRSTNEDARELYPEIFENVWISDGFWPIGQKKCQKFNFDRFIGLNCINVGQNFFFESRKCSSGQKF